MKLKYLFVLLFFSIFTDAQNSFELEDTEKTVIPFKLIANLIFVPVNINGADLTFMLDTGVAETSIFSLENQELTLPNVEKIKFSGLGGTASIDGFRSDNNVARIGKNFINRSATLYIITEQDFNISSHVGIPVNGIIGYHFFKNHPIVIDYYNRKITVYHHEDIFRKKLKGLKRLTSQLKKTNLICLPMWK
uniref:Retropepsin-like aspartic protease n=1 Tax=Chryseobacterium endophyticum TaxID=1854762 RepID=A0AAU6WSF7_9FLAO